MTDPEKNLVLFLLFLAVMLGGFAGFYLQWYNIPTCKIWDNNRTYDRILVADDVICKDATNATYYHYDTVRYMGKEYILNESILTESPVKEIVVCR